MFPELPAQAFWGRLYDEAAFQPSHVALDGEDQAAC